MTLRLNGLFYDRNELINAPLRPEATITATLDGSPVTIFSPNQMFNGSNDFGTIPLSGEPTTVVILVDLGTNQANYADATWQPGYSARLGFSSTEITNPKNIKVEISTDNVNWAEPTGGQWQTSNAVADAQADTALWMGDGGNPLLSGSLVVTYRYVRYTLTDFNYDTSYAFKNSLWIRQLIFRHRAAPPLRQYLSASGDRMLGDLEVVGDVTVTDEAYNATSWNGNNEVPTKNAIRDKIESMGGGGGTTNNFQNSTILTEFETLTTGTGQTFTLPTTSPVFNVERNGRSLLLSEWSQSGTTLTVSGQLDTNDTVKAYQQVQSASGSGVTLSQTTAPSPASGTSVTWVASGSGTKDTQAYDEADVLMTSVSQAGVSKTLLILDHSTLITCLI